MFSLVRVAMIIVSLYNTRNRKMLCERMCGICAPMPVHMEARRRCRVPCFTMLYLIPLRQGLPLNLDRDRLAASMAQ